MNPKVDGSFESPSGRDIFCLKNFDTFTRTPVGVLKMNALACAQLTSQMLTLLKKNIYTARASVQNMGQQMSGPDSSIGWSIRHESKGWGFESPSGQVVFCLKNLTLSKEHPFVCQKWMLLPAHS